MQPKTAFKGRYVLMLLTLLVGCRQEDRPIDQTPRAVKLATAYISEGVSPRFTATIRQERHTDLAFENGGRVASIDVDVGDHVQRGRILARLDPELAGLRLQQTDASVRAAAAQLEERQAQMARQQAMFDDGAISSTTLTGARVALETAKAQLASATADRAIARRATRQQTILAPYDGYIVARLLQPHVDTSSGQTVLRMEGAGRPQAVATLPMGRSLEHLAPGSEVQAFQPDHPGSVLRLRLRGLSSQVTSGNTVEAIFDVLDPRTPVRSGQSLLLTIPGTTSEALTVPVAAVLPQDKGNRAWTFVFDTRSGVVHKRDVEIGAIEGERIEIRAGLAQGDQVVAAGAAFLVDGEHVVAFHPATRLTDWEAQ